MDQLYRLLESKAPEYPGKEYEGVLQMCGPNDYYIEPGPSLGIPPEGT